MTLMIAGNIPGRTQTLPLAIYDAVQTRQYDEANMMVLVLSAFALVYIWGLIQLSQPIRFINRKKRLMDPPNPEDGSRPVWSILRGLNQGDDDC